MKNNEPDLYWFQAFCVKAVSLSIAIAAIHVLGPLQLSGRTDKSGAAPTFDSACQAKLEAQENTGLEAEKRLSQKLGQDALTLNDDLKSQQLRLVVLLIATLFAAHIWVTQKNAGLLESEKRHSQEFNQSALTLVQNTNPVNLSFNLKIVAGNDNTMTDNKNQGINTGANSFVNTGTHQMTNSILNMSGAVTNALNQLPNTTTEEPGIRELLTQLQTAIESDPELSEKGKTNALEQVKTLAEVGQNPEQPEKKSLGEKAMIFLKGTIATLSGTAKLAEAAKVLLPLIAKALGLPV
ncbi:hypothetical protein ACKFKF_24220 [Phormidesmis sp. 146-12]